MLAKKVLVSLGSHIGLAKVSCDRRRAGDMRIGRIEGFGDYMAARRLVDNIGLPFGFLSPWTLYECSSSRC